MSQLSGSKRYFNAIDGLRLIASVNIVLFHLEDIGGLYNLGGSPAWLFRVLKGPAFHATIFFILGGFIFATKFSAQAATFKTLPFIKKRLSELYPLHALTTVLMILIFMAHKIPSGSLDITKLFFSAFMHLSLLWSLFPFFSYQLNTPSWALSAFFLCYILFGPILRLTLQINKKRVLFLLSVLCFSIVLLWGLLYGAIGSTQNLYSFFHIFAPVRFFEFGIGMLLARFFQLTTGTRKNSLVRSIFNNSLILISVILIYQTLTLRTHPDKTISFIAYHSLLTPMYVVILYCLADERGLIPRILSIPFIRMIGRSSFYPYLIHIPLISSISLFCEKFLNYKKFLHEPLNITLFMVVLYGGSVLYMHKFRKKRKTPVSTKQVVSYPEAKDVVLSDKYHQ